MSCRHFRLGRKTSFVGLLGHYRIRILCPGFASVDRPLVAEGREVFYDVRNFSYLPDIEKPPDPLGRGRRCANSGSLSIALSSVSLASAPGKSRGRAGRPRLEYD